MVRVDLLPSLESLRVADPAGPGLVTMATTVGQGAVDASGLALVEQSVPLSAGTLVYAASLAKLVTALCVHRLALDGALDLDEPVGRWFPALADGRRISVRHLLLHRSGLPEYHALRLLAGHSVDDRLEQEDVRRLVDGMTVWFEPGTRVSYNNTNFAMLAMVVETITGESFAAAARRLVFDPAGMNHALVKRHPDEVLNDAAAGYFTQGGGLRRAVMGVASIGDGGMWWCGADLAALGRWLLVDRPEVIEMRRQVPLPDGSVPTLATGCAVAPDGSWFGGSAEFTGFCAELRVYPGEGVAIGLMSNRQEAQPKRRLDLLANSLGLPQPTVVAPRRLTADRIPEGVLVGVGGSSWRFIVDDSDAGTIGVKVGELSLRLVPVGGLWQVEGAPSHTAGWDGDEFVVRDGNGELARLRVVGGGMPTDDDMARLAGWWWCPSACAALRVTHLDGDLWIRRGQGPEETLSPVGERSGCWVLAAPWGLVEMERAGSGGSVTLGRAEGVRLVRLGRIDDC